MSVSFFDGFVTSVGNGEVTVQPVFVDVNGNKTELAGAIAIMMQEEMVILTYEETVELCAALRNSLHFSHKQPAMIDIVGLELNDPS